MRNMPVSSPPFCLECKVPLRKAQCHSQSGAHSSLSPGHTASGALTAGGGQMAGHEAGCAQEGPTLDVMLLEEPSERA